MGNKQNICHNDKTTYVGETKKKQFHGNGTLYYNETGNLYKGEFKKGQKHGFGEINYYNGDKYIGEFYCDELHGKGKYYNNNGYTYEGIFSVGSLLGKGNMYDTNGDLIYEGDFLNNLPHGFGISYRDGKISYIGKWNQNLYHGHGLLIDNGINKYGLFQEGILTEQINKIPVKIHKYIDSGYSYNSNKKRTSKIVPISKSLFSIPITSTNSVIPINLYQKPKLTEPRITENPFNRILPNSIILPACQTNKNCLNNMNKNLTKIAFNPTNTR